MAIYDEATLGTSNNQLTFNDYTQTPIYRTKSRQPQRRQIRDLDLPVPFESGIADFETFIGQTTYVIEGTMYPGSESEYDEGLSVLRRVASVDIAQDDADSDYGYVPYTWSEFVRDKQVYVRVLWVDLPENTRQGLVQPFRFLCKIKDPTIFSADSKTASTQGVDPTTASGTAIFPVAFPIIFGASTYSVSNSANNEGDIATYPASITVVGPVNSPIITNTTTGEYIQVNTNLASSSQSLVIVYDKDSLSVTKGGVSVQNLVTTGSTYFKLEPGINTFTLSGSSIGSGAYVAINYRDAWPLS